MEENKNFNTYKIILKSNLKCIWIYTLFYILIDTLFSVVIKGNKDFYGIVISILLCIIIGCFLNIFLLFKMLKWKIEYKEITENDK